MPVTPCRDCRHFQRFKTAGPIDATGRCTRFPTQPVVRWDATCGEWAASPTKPDHR